MVRTKKIYRQHLLQGAFQLIIEQGFENFHARHIAKKMSCSTQPIYREFQTLLDFKEAACEYILAKVKEEVKLAETTSSTHLTDNICQYAKRSPQEFQRFFLMDERCRKEIKSAVLKDFKKFPSSNDQEDFETFWYATLGKAAVESYKKPTA